MSREHRWQDLARATAEASRRLPAAPLPGLHRPGDVLLHPQVCEGGIRWVVLAGDERELWVVPADLSPMAGSADLAVPAAEAGGPLTLRGSCGLRLPAAALAPEWRVGSLAPSRVAAAREAMADAEAGRSRAPVLAREVDEDPEYEDWLREVVRPAREALQQAGPAVRRPRGGFPLARALAAAFGAVAIGLLLWALALEGQIGELTAPFFGWSRQELDFVDTVRSDGPSFSRHLGYALLVLIAPEGEPPFGAFRYTIFDAAGRRIHRREVARQEPATSFFAELGIILRPRRLGAGTYRIELVGLRGGEEEALGWRELRITDD